MADKLNCGLLFVCLCIVITLCRPEGPRMRSYLKDQGYDQDGSELLDFGSRKSNHLRSNEDLMDISSDEDGDSRGATRYGGDKRGLFRYGYDKGEFSATAKMVAKNDSPEIFDELFN